MVQLGHLYSGTSNVSEASLQVNKDSSIEVPKSGTEDAQEEGWVRVPNADNFHIVLLHVLQLSQVGFLEADAEV